MLDQPTPPMEQPLRRYWWSLVLIVASAFVLFGSPVPASNEWIYLLGPYRMWHPSFLPNDWTFSQPWWEHLLFNVAAGAPTLLFSLPVVAWAGRIVSWALCGVALLQLGRRMGLEPVRAAPAILLWLAFGQALYGGEWMIETFEAKPFAYASLLFALDGLMAGRYRRAGLLLGLTFALHPSVGLSGGVAALVAAAVMRPTGPEWRSLIGWGAVAALPGLLMLLPVLLSEGSARPQDWEFLANVRAPPIFQPFGPGRRYVVVSFAMLGVMGLYGWSKPVGSPARVLALFTAVLGVITIFGIASIATGHYEWLRVFPFRLFPLFSLLGFFLVLAGSIRQVRSRVQVAIVALAVLTLLPIIQYPLHAIPMARRRGGLWHQDTAFVEVLDWIARETPPASVVLLPPWRPDAYYLGRRSLVVNWQAIRYDDLPEWRRRMEALVGPITRSSLEDMYRGYLALTAGDVVRLAGEYGAGYLVSEGRYPFPVEFSADSYTVYRVTDQLPAPDENSTPVVP